MQVWELAMELELPRWAPTILLSNKVKTGETVLELEIANLNADYGIENLYGKLNTFFLYGANQLPFMAYKSFKTCWRQSDESVDNFLRNLGCHVLKLKDCSERGNLTPGSKCIRLCFACQGLENMSTSGGVLQPECTVWSRRLSTGTMSHLETACNLPLHPLTRSIIMRWG